MRQSPLFLVFLALIVLAPLPLGSHRPWSGALVVLVLGLCAMWWAVLAWRGQVRSGVGWRPLLVPLLGYASALVWTGFQMLPLAPAAWVHPLWSEAAIVLPDLPPLVSMAPSRGAEEWAQWLGNGLAFLLAAQMGRSGRRAWRLVESLGLGLGLIALYGLVVHLLGSETIGWLDKWAYRGDLTGVLVNRNHAANLSALGLLCAVAASLRRWRDHGGRGYLRSLLDGKSPWPFLLVASATLCAIVIPLTHSRAGTLVAALGLPSLLALSRRWRQMGLTTALLLVVAAPVVSVLESRLTQIDLDGGQRLQVWRLSLGLLGQRPWLGHGLGAFPDLFQSVRPETLAQVWTEAHNSWLETLVELGIPAALCVFLALSWVWGRCVIGAMTRRQERILPALGAAAGLVEALHCLVDFPIQIPAIALAVAALMGIGFAQSWSVRRGPLVE